jgi:hypothetical protein
MSERFCPCCEELLDKPCFDYSGKMYCSCGFYVSYLFIKDKVSKQFYLDIKKKRFDHILSEEYKHMPHTQHYVRPTREIKRLDSEIKQVQEQINQLKQNLNVLKGERKEEEFKLCTRYDNKNFRHSCHQCRGVVFEKSCFLCDQPCSCIHCESEPTVCQESSSTPTSSTPTSSTPREIVLPSSFSDRKEWKRIITIRETIYPTLHSDLNEDAFRELRIRFLLEELTKEEYEGAMIKMFQKNEHKLEYYYLIHHYLLFV